MKPKLSLFPQNPSKNFIKIFFLPYFLLFLILFIPQIFVYYKYSSTLEKEFYKKGESITKRYSHSLDSELAEIQNISIQIILQSKMAYTPLSKDLTSDTLFQYAQLLSPYQNINKNLKNLFIYIPEQDIFLQSKSFTKKGESFYKTYIQNSNTPYPLWKYKFTNVFSSSYFESETSLPSLSTSRPERVINYISSFKIRGEKIHNAFLINQIIPRELYRDFDKSHFNGGGNFFICDNEKILSSFKPFKTDEFNFQNIRYKNKITIGGHNFYLYRFSSKRMKLHYIALFSDKIIMETLYSLKGLSFISSIILLGLGVLFTLGFAFKSFKPFKKMTSSLALAYNKETNFSNLNSLALSVENLVLNNTDLKKAMAEQKRYQKARLLSRLLLGDIEDQVKLKTLLDYFESPIKNKNYLLIIAKLDGFEKASINSESLQKYEEKRLLFKEFVRQNLKEQFLYQLIQSDKLALLIYSPYSIAPTNYIKTLTSISKKVKDKIDLKPSFVLSSPYINPLETARAYKEIDQFFNTPLLKDRFVYLIEEEDRGDFKYSYTLETEQKLLSFISMGESEQAQNLIKEIREKNKNIALHRKLTILNEISATLIKAGSTIFDNEKEFFEFENSIRLAKKSENISSFYEKIAIILGSLCILTDSKKESHNSHLRLSLLKYVEEHFCDFDLNLYKVSCQFNLSEKYLSRFFKDQTGLNFSSYIEELRMKKAVMLMKESTDSLSIISEKVGYATHNTFYKAFKRRFSMSPGVYRNKTLK